MNFYNASHGGHRAAIGDLSSARSHGDHCPVTHRASTSRTSEAASLTPIERPPGIHRASQGMAIVVLLHIALQHPQAPIRAPTQTDS